MNLSLASFVSVALSLSIVTLALYATLEFNGNQSTFEISLLNDFLSKYYLPGVANWIRAERDSRKLRRHPC